MASVVLLHHPKRPWTWLSFVRAARRARYDAVVDCKVLSPSLTLLLLKQASNYLGAKVKVIRTDFGQRTHTIPAQTGEAAQVQGSRG